MTETFVFSAFSQLSLALPEITKVATKTTKVPVSQCYEKAQ